MYSLLSFFDSLVLSEVEQLRSFDTMGGLRDKSPSNSDSSETKQLKNCLLEHEPILGYQAPMDIILEDDIRHIRQHPFFHTSFIEKVK